MDEVYLEEATKSVIELLQQITEKLNTLESIDKSIDFLAAAMTGMDPLIFRRVSKNSCKFITTNSRKIRQTGSY